MHLKNNKNFILPVILCLFLILTMFNIKKNNINKQFKDYVVFYPQHQDDEVLWAGSAIVEAIKERGQDNVFVVLVSNGSGIAVFDKNEQYKNLTKDQKSSYRNREFLASLNSLGVKDKNIIILPELNSNGYTDFNAMESIALEFEKNFTSVTHVAHTYKFDNHLQHIKNGSIIQGLYNTGKIKDAKYFVKPQFAYKIFPTKKIIYNADSNEEYKMIKEACKQYKIIDIDNQREGIGYKSDHKSFDKLLKNKTAPSILHTPNV